MVTQGKKRALLSVTNKQGIVDFARELVGLNTEILSTGGTAKALRDAGVPVTPVEDVTRFPEMLDGRVKTLHPAVFGGILAVRSKPSHMDGILQHGILPIDLVVVNLYDFEHKKNIEEIDIGGPSLLRAAAKNAAAVTVVCDPEDYPSVLFELKTHGAVSDRVRASLAVKVFERTAAYDAAIAHWMLEQLRAGSQFLEPNTAAMHG